MTSSSTTSARPAERPGPRTTRARILLAAQRILTQADLADIRVEDILTEASVSRRTFYQHFSGKTALAAGILESAVAGMIGEAAGLKSAEISVAEKIARTVDLYLALWRNDGRVMLSIVRESQRSGSSLAAQREQAIAAFVQFTCSALSGEGIRVTRERARFAVLGAEAMLMLAAQHDELGNRRLRGEIVRAVQALLLGDSPPTGNPARA